MEGCPQGAGGGRGNGEEGRDCCAWGDMSFELSIVASGDGVPLSRNCEYFSMAAATVACTLCVGARKVMICLRGLFRRGLPVHELQQQVGHTLAKRQVWQKRCRLRRLA